MMPSPSNGAYKRARLRLGLALALTTSIAGIGASSALASAAAPAWTITVVSGPTNFTPGEHTGEDNYVVIATNSGGAPTHPGTITLTDKLPAGLTADPTPAGNSELRIRDDAGNEEGLECTAGPSVTCTDSQAEYRVQPGESVWITVPVDVAGTAPSSVLNEVSVSGGGPSECGVPGHPPCPAAAASEPTTISATPASFGFPAGPQGFDGAVSEPDGTTATQAGSHPYQATLGFVLASKLTNTVDAASGEAKDVTANLPAGVIVNPNATPAKCTESQLEFHVGTGGSLCPVASAVGTVRLTFGLIGFPTTETEPLYNMVPPHGAPAELGFDALAAGIFVHLRGQVRTGGDYGLSATSNDILQEGSVIGVSATLWGNPSDPSHDVVRGNCFGGGHRPPKFCPVAAGSTALLTLPTSCSGPLATTIEADSWQEPGRFISDSFLSHDNSANPVGITGCAKLDFSPTITVKPHTTMADSPSGLNVDLRVPEEESLSGLAEAHLKNAVVTLPVGMSVNPSSANGLEACSSAQVNLHGAGPANCPDASKIGTVQITTPLLDHPLPGAVYLAAQNDNPFGSLLAIYIAIDDPQTGVVVKLAGHVVPDPLTGQLTTTFDENPQLPFSDLKLQFFGGPRAVLITPPTCGAYETISSFTPWSGTPPANLGSTFSITSGPGGGPCPTGQFTPSFTSGTTNNQGGGYSPFSVTFSRQDGEQRLSGAQVRTPPGLLGVLKSVVQCPEPQASLGTCGPESQIGHTTTGAGAGPDPFYVSGNVFLTGPYKGAPFGLSIVVHALAGPFDLGNVIVRARINVDPGTAQITVTSDALPTILQGIPLDLRTINVAIDRPGFTFNPTNCQALSVAGTITSTAGASAGVSSPFQAANCANLPFKPSFRVSTQGKTSKANGASLVVKVAQNPGEANIHKVNLQLPLALPSRLTTLQKACIASQFESNPAGCPEGSFVGTATAHTPLLAVPLTGPAILVSHGGAAFPDVVFVLQGEGIRIDLVGNTDIKKGITFSRFETVPDAPISRFETSLPEGPHSALAAYGSLCAHTKIVSVRKRVTRRVHGHVVHVLANVKQTVAEPLLMPTTITGQNGAVVTQTTKVAVTGCPSAKKAKKAKRASKTRHRKGKGRK